MLALDKKTGFWQIKYSPIPQFFILFVFALMIHHSKTLNEYFDEKLKNTEKYKDFIKYSIFTFPLLIIVITDMTMHSFSFNNLKMSKLIPNEYINYLLLILGIYGVVQVLSQDFGIKTGLKQNRFTKHPIVHFFTMFGAGFALSGQRSESFIGALIYMFLRNMISNKETIEACFEDV